MASAVKGIVYIQVNRCKGCGYCIAFCPPQALKFSDEFNAQGYHPPELVKPDNCTGCDLCGLYCPDFAIYAVMVKKDEMVAVQKVAPLTRAPIASEGGAA